MNDSKVKIEKFQAATMGQAVLLAKAKLGANAVVLHTKTIKKGGFMGLGTKAYAEVTASSDINVLVRAAKLKNKELLQPRRTQQERATERLQKAYATVQSESLVGAEKIVATSIEPESYAILNAEEKNREVHADFVSNLKVKHEHRMTDLQEEMTSIKTMLSSLVSAHKSRSVDVLPESLQETYAMLLDHEVSEQLAHRLVSRLNENLSGSAIRNREMIKERLMDYIKDMIDVAGATTYDSDGCHVIAFIGPTGVGKTTTIAKVATQLRMSEGRSVALITQDTYRIGAVDQLRKYAEILSVPLRVVNTVEEMENAIKSFSSKDVVLIDTAGRSQRNNDKLDELADFLEVAAPDEIHLVLSMTASEQNLLKVKERFDKFNPNRLILTKLDEAVAFGLILNIAAKVNTQLSYLTFGQEVPHDIEVGCADKISRLIMGERELAS